MSGANFARNQSLPYNQVNTQKTLIYDLRSELSNLKNQFSRLISKPTDLASKSKIDIKTTSKSRYSHVDSDTSLHESQMSMGSQYHISYKSTQAVPRANLVRTDSHMENKSNQTFERLSYYNRKNSNHQPVTTTNIPITTESERKLVEIKKAEGQSTPTSLVKKSPDFTTFYKKFHGSAYEAGEKVSASSKLSNKTTEISSDAMNQSAYLDQLGAAAEKIKKLELENKEYAKKDVNLTQQVSEMQSKINRMQKQMQGQKLESNRKVERISKLQEQVKQLTTKFGKASQEIGVMSRDKNKQIDLLKKGHENELKNVQNQFERRVATQKKNYDAKLESSLNNMKQTYEVKIAEMKRQNERVKTQLSANCQFLDKAKAEMCELQRKEQKLQAKLQQSTLQVKVLQQKVKAYSEKQSELEGKIKQKPQTKQMGISAVEQKKQIESTKTVSPTSSEITKINIEAQEKQKQLQEKLTNYLNNIDKQSQKIKEQKAEMERNQRVIEDSNRVICEKQSMIRNLMRDCKIMEKDLIEHRRMRRELELLVEQANSSLSQLHLANLNNKYRDL